MSLASLLCMCDSHGLHAIYMIVLQGAAKTLGNTWSSRKAAWVSALVAAGTSFICAVAVLPILRIRSRKHQERMEAEEAAAAQNSKKYVGALSYANLI